jgi:hypothetical protein
MTFFTIASSLGLGLVTGILYGFFFTKKDLTLPNNNTEPKQLRKENFLSFFFMATLRILLMVLLWHYVLRSSSLNIILVLVSFLAGFWAVIIKKKVINE